MTDDVRLETLGRRAIGIGAVSLLVLGVGGLFDHDQFFRSYLFGYLPWFGISLGALAVLMLHHVAGGEWAFVIRRILEAAVKNLPILAVAFIPVLLGIGSLYAWSRPSGVDGAILEHKRAYLNVPFFAARTVLYFSVWLALGRRLVRLSRRQDDGEGAGDGPLRAVSAPGLVLYGLTATFASFDWVMSLEFHWYSTIYGVSFITGQCLSALAFSAVVLHLVSDRPLLATTLRASHFHALGNMILAFIMLWAYMAFSQYLILWSANLPEGILWYLHRAGGWQALALALVVLHFAVPFCLLLSRASKRGQRSLAAVAALVLVMRFADNFWLVAPAFHHDRLTVHWMDAAAPVGLGGLWVGLFCLHLRRRPLLPEGDRRFRGSFSRQEAFGHG